MKTMFRSLLLASLACGILPCSAFAAEKWKNFVNEEYNTTLRAPASWTGETNLDSPFPSVLILLAVTSPKESRTDTYLEKVVLVLENIPTPEALSRTKPFTLKEYTDLSMSMIKENVDDFRIISKRKTTFADSPATAITYRFTDATGMKLQNKAIIALNPDATMGASITLRATPRSLRKYENIFDRIAASVKNAR